MPILKKKALKKHYWVLFEHYLDFCKQERLKDWWKPENQPNNYNCLLWKAIFSSSSVLCHCLVMVAAITVVGGNQVNMCQCVDTLTRRSLCFHNDTRGSNALVDCGVQWGFARCCLTDKCTTWCHAVCCMSRHWTIVWTSRNLLCSASSMTENIQ